MYEYLAPVEIRMRNAALDDKCNQATRFSRLAKHEGALATDILESGNELYCNTLWETEGAWRTFARKHGLRKKPGKHLWILKARR